MHPRTLSHQDSRAISPAATLGVAVGSPGFAGTAARTAHSPSADAQPEAADAPVATDATDAAESADLAPFVPAANSPTGGERVEPLGTPSDDGSIADDPAGSIAPAASLRDVEGGGGNADLVDVIPAVDGAAPAEAATWGQDAG